MSTAWIFDVDGVVTDPKEKKVIEPELFALFAKLLIDKHLLAFNTGRSTSWVEERVIDPLRRKLSDKKLLSDFMVIGEKGGTWMTFDESGTSTSEKDQSFIIPQNVSEALRTKVETTYHDSMFFDTTKETMVSIEMHDGFDLKHYHDIQQAFLPEVEAILDETKAAEHLKIDPSIIAVDVEDKRANKALGVARFLTFLRAKKLTPNKFFAFGDSLGDLAMADELEKQGKEVSFVFVGDKEKVRGVERKYPINVVAGYSRGTLLFLEKELKKVSAGSSYN